jgi:hypothetical protein
MNIEVCGDVRIDPPVLNLGTIQVITHQVHVLAVLVLEVEPQHLLHERLGELLSRSGCFAKQKISCRCRELTTISRSNTRQPLRYTAIVTRLRLGNDLCTIRATSSVLHTCTRSNVHRTFKIWNQLSVIQQSSRAEPFLRI